VLSNNDQRIAVSDWSKTMWLPAKQ